MVHVPLMFLSEWREFPLAPCLAKKKLDDSSRLDVVEIAHVAWHASFSLCNKKRLAIRHMNIPLFPTTLSILSYDIGKQVGLRTYQHTLVKLLSIAFQNIMFILHALASMASCMFWVFWCYGVYCSGCMTVFWDTQWRIWSRHCTTSWKGAGPIPVGVIGILHWLDPFSYTAALGLTQPLTEMSTSGTSWG